MQTRIVPLFKGNMISPVQINRDFRGASGRRIHGVKALVVTHEERSWCLIADHPENEGVSATNGFVDYAHAVCQELGLVLDSVTWFELDSMGRFDAWRVDQICPGHSEMALGGYFTPIQEEGMQPSTLDAFLAYLDRLGLRRDGNGLRMMLDAMLAPFRPHGGMLLN